jgi:hypothetical protein
MTPHEPSIFREESVRRRYGPEQPVLPPFVSRKAFVGLWGLTALLVAGDFAAWSTPVRAQLSGVAVAIDNKTLVAFLPAQSRSHLRVGQSMRLTSGDGGQAFIRPIVSIDPEVISAEAARRRYELDLGAAKAITGPAAVAIARCESPAGRVYRVTVDGGSRPLFSVLPLMGSVETRP